MSKFCKVCGKENSKSGVAFCSEECRKTYDLQHEHLITCEHCGKQFPLPVRMDGTYHVRHFCSDECSRLNYREKTKYKKTTCVRCGKEITVERDEKTNRFPPLRYQLCEDCKVKGVSDRKKRVCRHCGKTFEPHSESAFCSQECYTKYEFAQTHGSDSEQPMGVCKCCGKTFPLPKDKNGRYNKDVMFCSSECGTKQYFIEHPLPDRYCATCGKLLVRGDNEDLGNFKRRKYCNNPECRREGQVAKFIHTCMERYGVPFSCLLRQASEAEGTTKVSKTNREFAAILEEVGIKSKLDEIVLGIYSYDLWLEGTNILLEINPTYTHNVYGNHYNNWTYDEGLITKHLDKTNVAQENGYRCIHVWQWDDWNKIVKLLLPKGKVYARQLRVKPLSKSNVNAFLDSNHLQGACYGNKVSLGLLDKDDSLVQVMTFGTPRYNKKYQWELLRLCTVSNTFVVGGAEKLFSHFVKEYKPESIISYCDVSKFTGKVYERLGFTLVQQTSPAKVWSKGRQYITDNLLRQKGADQLIKTHDGKGTDNEEVMLREGWLPVYDCGQKVFIWERK